MPNDPKKLTSLTLNTTSSSQENNDDLNNEPTKESQDGALPDKAENSPNKASDNQKQGFFGTRRKEMVPMSAQEQEAYEQPIEFKSKARYTEQYLDPLQDYDCQLGPKNTQKVSPKGGPLLPFFSINAAPKLSNEKNLSPDLYQSFLQEFFTLNAEKNTKETFILTGSAAKQLQNPLEKNPNDIDILLNRSDLVEGIWAFKAVVAQMNEATIAADDHGGTLSINYQGTLLKVQLIDYHTSSYCFPLKEDMKKLKKNGAIIMLDASIIPQKELVDENDDLGSDIEFSILFQ